MTVDPFIESLVGVVRLHADPTPAVKRLLNERDESLEIQYLREIRRLKDVIRELKERRGNG